MNQSINSPASDLPKLEISKAPLFQGITITDIEKMYDCLQARRCQYKAGETICTFDGSPQDIGIVVSGSLTLERIDYFGNRFLLDRLEADDIFGETLSFAPSTEYLTTVICENDCQIIFIAHELISKPCSKVCTCHVTMIENLLSMISTKAQRLSSRVEVLVNRTIRDKLMCYFLMEAQKNSSDSFTLPFTVSELAAYLCVDRSAMIREISKLKKDGILDTNRRNIRLLKPQNEL